MTCMHGTHRARMDTSASNGVRTGCPRSDRAGTCVSCGRSVQIPPTRASAGDATTRTSLASCASVMQVLTSDGALSFGEQSVQSTTSTRLQPKHRMGPPMMTDGYVRECGCLRELLEEAHIHSFFFKLFFWRLPAAGCRLWFVDVDAGAGNILHTAPGTTYAMPLFSAGLHRALGYNAGVLLRRQFRRLRRACSCDHSSP